jgi:hypothetical protein
VQQLLVVPESGFLVTLSSESVRVWQYSEGRMIREWRHPSNGLRSLCLLRKSRRIVCGTDQANIVIFSLDEVMRTAAAVTRPLRLICPSASLPRRRERPFSRPRTCARLALGTGWPLTRSAPRTRHARALRRAGQRGRGCARTRPRRGG